MLIEHYSSAVEEQRKMSCEEQPKVSISQRSISGIGGLVRSRGVEVEKAGCLVAGGRREV